MITEVLAVAQADFKQRSRTKKWLVVPVLLAYFAKLITVDTSLVVGEEYTGVPTAAWYGAMLCAIGTLLLFLFGCALVRGGITRDRQPGLAELISTAPLSNASYLLGKWLSNFLLLTVTTGVLAGLTAVAFLLQGAGSFDGWALFSPYLFVTIPTIAVVAAAAVCFESNRFLCGTGGNVLYVSAAVAVIILGTSMSELLDVGGIYIFGQSMGAAIAEQYPSFDGSGVGFFYTNSASELKTFTWSGVRWTAEHVLLRIPQLLAAGGLLVTAHLSFNRLDDAGLWTFRSALPFSSNGYQTAGQNESASPSAVLSPTSESSSSLGSLSPVTRTGFQFKRVFGSELRLAVQNRPRWWYVACLLAVLSSFIPSVDALRSAVLPLALLLPLSLWSELGAREQIHRTEELVFVTGGPYALLAASYLSATTVGLAITLPAGIIFAINGAFGAMFAWIVGLLALPAIASALGTLTGSQLAFETAYLVAWYAGPMNGFRPLDYIGAEEATVGSGVTTAYLVLAIVALGAAAFARRQT
ncbi:hypothetical protein [Halobacterium salinarum]|uniref:ABC transporter permease n=1 Tax=Halobacterium salinarum TaxID=2242 RepID=UPI00298D5904|nr:hypothetical protein [Halobacterium salinarum]WOY07761.1 hypothetical protein QSJ49_13225 [Halobacterium salinarum]